MMKTWEWVVIAVVAFMFLGQRRGSTVGAMGAQPRPQPTSAGSAYNPNASGWAQAGTFINQAGPAIGSWLGTLFGSSGSSSGSSASSSNYSDSLMAPSFSSGGPDTSDPMVGVFGLDY